jgi:hypothetical protein
LRQQLGQHQAQRFFILDDQNGFHAKSAWGVSAA